MKTYNFSLKKTVFQTLSCLEGRVCVFPPQVIWGGIAIYVREWLGPAVLKSQGKHDDIVLLQLAQNTDKQANQTVTV